MLSPQTLAAHSGIPFVRGFPLVLSCSPVAGAVLHGPDSIFVERLQGRRWPAAHRDQAERSMETARSE